MHASVLIAYLSADKVASQESEWTSKSQWLFHESMKIVLQPLKEAGVGGVLMTNASGEVHRVHPILASYVADYPEQILVTCAKYGSCPKCECCKDDLGSAKRSPLQS